MPPRWDKAVGVQGRLGRSQVFQSVCTCVPAGVHGCVCKAGRASRRACTRVCVHRGVCIGSCSGLGVQLVEHGAMGVQQRCPGNSVLAYAGSDRARATRLGLLRRAADPGPAPGAAPPWQESGAGTLLRAESAPGGRRVGTWSRTSVPRIGLCPGSKQSRGTALSRAPGDSTGPGGRAGPGPVAGGGPVTLWPEGRACFCSRAAANFPLCNWSIAPTGGSGRPLLLPLHGSFPAPALPRRV